jgi:hypothetical protein
MELKESLRIAGKRNAKVFTVEQNIKDLSPEDQDWLRSRQEMALRRQNQQVIKDLDKNQNE